MAEGKVWSRVCSFDTSTFNKYLSNTNWFNTYSPAANSSRDVSTGLQVRGCATDWQPVHNILLFWNPKLIVESKYQWLYIQASYNLWRNFYRLWRNGSRRRRYSVPNQEALTKATIHNKMPNINYISAQLHSLWKMLVNLNGKLLFKSACETRCKI